MNTKQVCLGLWLVLVLALTSGGASAQDDTALLELDFEDGQIPANLDVTDGWRVVRANMGDGTEARVLQGVARGTTELLTILDAAEWDNYSLEMQVRLFGSADLFLNTRLDLEVADCLTGFVMSMSRLGDYTDLQAYGTDCTYSTVDSGGDASLLPMDEWFILRVDNVGSTASVYVNDEPILSGRGATPARGIAGLFLFEDMIVEINYIRAMPIESTEVANVGTASSVTLASFEGRHADIVAELQSLGIVPEGGRFLYSEPYAFFSGSGNYFTPLLQRANYTNIVMGAELRFRVGDPAQIETCSLLSRVQSTNSGSTSGSLSVQLVNEGSVLVVDGEQSDYVALGLDISEPHRVVIAAIDDEVSVFVDGQLVIDRMTVTPRSGFFGLGLVGRARAARCEGINVWMYQFDE